MNFIHFTAYVVQSIMPLKSILMQGFNIFDDIPPYADDIYAAMKKWAEEVSRH